MDNPSPIFTNIFNRCLKEFFDDEQKDKALGELFELLHGTNKLPEPRECGIHKIRVKQLLPNSNTIVYYWNYGRVWQFFGIIENGNQEHIEKLNEFLSELEE